MRGAMTRPKAKLIWVNFILNIVKEEIINKTIKNFRENRGFLYWS